jgi:hypothetical protein
MQERRVGVREKGERRVGVEKRRKGGRNKYMKVLAFIFAIYSNDSNFWRDLCIVSFF